MAEKRVQRRLAAILAADVVGYSRLMEREEAVTLATLKARRKEVLEPLVARHQGRIFKVTGDGVFVEFGSAVNAVQCAVELQQGMAAANGNLPEARRIVLRIGINLGDVIVEGSDLYGDGINIAVRLEGIAEPGGILISGAAYDQVSSKVNSGFEDMGTQTLKNISQPVRTYRVTGTRVAAAAAVKAALDKASIAVLPFTNMSGDPEQEYFADGLAEDLITDLSKVPGLFVISRHSSFAFKGRPIDIRSIASNLGVRFVIEGSVRRATSRVRINVQLIDAKDGTHAWADRFDRELTDFFLLQDEVVGKIVSALSSLLPPVRRITRRKAANLEAYDFFVRGRVLVSRSLESNRAARPLLERALELDPGFADAYAWLAASYNAGWVYWAEPAETHRSLALAAAQRAVSLDPENAVAHAILGHVLTYEGKPDAAAAELARALRINPNHADAWVFLSEAKMYAGRPLEAIDHVKMALRLNPHPPGLYYWYLGYIEYALGRYEDAVETLRHEATHRSESQRILAASLAQLGRIDEAKIEVMQFLAAHPDFSIQHWADTQQFQREADRLHFVQAFVEGYRKAGLPE